MQEQSTTAPVPKEGKISDFVPQKGQVHKLSYVGKAGAITDFTHALKESFSGLSVYCFENTYLGIMNEAASESETAKHLCEAYGIPMEATASFGGNFSDINMLLATGTCSAMSNAPPEIRRQMRNVAEDNDHGGVLTELERLNFAENRV